MRTPARRFIAASVAIGLGAFLVDQAPSAAAGHAVRVKDFAFQPATVQVAVGDTVTWTNEDTSQHTATADNGSFHIPLNAGASGTATFQTAGTIAYGCNIHPSMRAVVQVGPASGTTTTTAATTTTTRATTSTTAGSGTTTTTRQTATTAGATTATTAARSTATTAARATATTVKPKRCRKGFRKVRVRVRGKIRIVCRRIKR